MHLEKRGLPYLLLGIGDQSAKRPEKTQSADKVSQRPTSRPLCVSGASTVRRLLPTHQRGHKQEHLIATNDVELRIVFWPKHNIPLPGNLGIKKRFPFILFLITYISLSYPSYVISRDLSLLYSPLYHKLIIESFLPLLLNSSVIRLLAC